MEQSRSLKTIQVLAKIAKVLSMIVFVFCVVGAVLSTLALTASFFVKNIGIRGHIFSDILEKKVGVQYWVVPAILGACVVCTVCEAILAKLSHSYFSREIEDGTPFTEGGAKQLKRTGIIIIVVSLCLVLVLAIVFGVIKSKHAFDFDVFKAFVERHSDEVSVTVRSEPDFSLSGIGSVGTGIMFLILSVIFRYGSEVRSAAGFGKDGISPSEDSEPSDEL
jgi:hypothetical protein